MKAIIANPKYAAIASFLLALPFMTLFLLWVLGIEPNLGPLDPAFKSIDTHLGSLIVLGALLLLLAGLAICVIPIMQSIKTGSCITAYPINLLLASVIILFIVALIGAIVVDQ